ncbi:MAG: bifunctional diguanylate cyclase/phosphodiesterase [Chromatiaceae bacterium]|jgi:diguanylate cyclase (GGDEF)-like protein
MTGRRGLTIGTYALLLVGLVALIFVAYGTYTYAEFQRLRADIQTSHESAARGEVRSVMERLFRDAARVSARLAATEGIARRLTEASDDPAPRDLLTSPVGQLPDFVRDLSVYSPDGVAVGAATRSQNPARIAVPPPPVRVEFDGVDPAVVFVHPVTAAGVRPDDPILGYVAIRVDVLAQLRAHADYRYADGQSIVFERSPAEALTIDELPDRLAIALRDDPMNEAVNSLLSRAILNLSIIFAAMALTLFAALVFLIVRPLRAIASHVDRLKASPGGLMLGELAGVLPVAETEKIRESLNEYQSRLLDVHSSLEEKSHELWTLAHHDALTGARNRRAFDEFMQALPQQIGERDVGVCFALFDVNHFKAINDSYGHPIGDQVLKVIAGRIRAVLRRDEELFRIGGNEFAVVLMDCDESSALRIAERCHEKIVGYDFNRLGIREPLRISAGLASARIDDTEDLQTLQWKADIAMYRAKRPGHANVVMFSEELARGSEGLFSSWVNTAVYDAFIYGAGMTMRYQPIVDLQSGEICHYEALVRIERDGELIEPSNIFPVVEARRLELELDRAVIRRVVTDVKEGRVRPGTGVSLNLSGPTLVHDQVCIWMEEFRPFLKDYRVMIEVTETALITQIGLANQNLIRLRAQGFEVALDDFGSGYSSVRYLGSMPVDVVKFDISLVQQLLNSSQRKLVTHLAQMIQEVGPQLVAEGIEDMALLDAARSAGFDRGQGFLMGVPASRADRNRIAFDNVTAFPSDRRA